MNVFLILSITLFPLLVFGEQDSLPYELEQLKQQRKDKIAKEVEKIDKVYFESLQKYKIKYMEAGNLASANAAASLIDDVATTLQPTKKTSRLFDELENTKWHYKYGNSIILTFTLTRSGKVESDRHWIDFTWRVVSPSEITIDHPKGIKMIMTFDEGIKTFQGIDWDGKKFNGAKVLK